MALKTFGYLRLLGKGTWEITDCPAHVCIKLKSVFSKIKKNSPEPFHFKNTPENCQDLQWFIGRYPMVISDKDVIELNLGVNNFINNARRMEEILAPEYVPKTIKLSNGHEARKYQEQAADLAYNTKRLLLGDDIGLGKTLSGILLLLKQGTVPAIVVVQTHLTNQWKSEIERFTNMRAHIIKGTRPYNLPIADVYIIKYSCISGWVDTYKTLNFKTVIFDEVQELRRQGSNKYSGAQHLADSVEYVLGMSATPIYNFGDEIFSILNLIKPYCLGDFYDFVREWATMHGMNYRIQDPKALGSYLRDNYLFLRRTRAEVGRELPPINRIIHTVGYDDNEVKRIDSLARQLAMKIISGSFIERGSAARELDLLVRQETGVSKAREVAEYVKILLSNGEPVVLAGWHREVYEIWKEHLKEYNPVFYTGTESDVQKRNAKEDFISGKTDLFIISLRSGIGLDGLQKRCKTVVVGELDWSPQVHAQLIGRVDRDGQEDQVTAIFLVSEYGSDPVIIDLLGLKSSQAHSIINPLSDPVAHVSDDSRIKRLAESFLKKS